MEDLAKRTAAAVKNILVKSHEAFSKEVADVKKFMEELKSSTENFLTKDAIEEIVKTVPVPKDGKDGKDGEDGEDGRDGRDAIELEIIPLIDEERAYGRGTFAIHKGGLWRAFETTEGMRGWENVIDGIADISIEFDGERSFKISTEKSSGKIVTKEFVLPVPIDKGVYREGQTYAKHDGVTYAGSFWIAQRETKNKPGNGNDDFRLAVKAGRNASAPVKVGA